MIKRIESQAIKIKATHSNMVDMGEIITIGGNNFIVLNYVHEAFVHYQVLYPFSFKKENAFVHIRKLIVVIRYMLGL